MSYLDYIFSAQIELKAVFEGTRSAMEAETNPEKKQELESDCIEIMGQIMAAEEAIEFYEVDEELGFYDFDEEEEIDEAPLPPEEKIDVYDDPIPF